jgi:hypothetical protein
MYNAMLYVKQNIVFAAVFFTYAEFPQRRKSVCFITQTGWMAEIFPDLSVPCQWDS